MASRVILTIVPRQKPPSSTGKLTGFPYKDLWEEFGEPGERLYAHGLERELIDRSFKRARELGATDLRLTVDEVSDVIAPLGLSAPVQRQLAEQLYYLAGHYYSPRFHALFGDAPADVRSLTRRVASTAKKLDKLMSELTPAVQRYLGGARWKLGKQRRSSPKLQWSVLQDQIVDLSNSAMTVANEFPRFGRGNTVKVLQGRWLRQSAEAVEEATGRPIETRVSDSAGPNYRFQGVEGTSFQAYCNAVDKHLAPKTLVQAVRAYQKYGIGGPPS